MNTLHLGNGNDSNNRGKLGGVRRYLKATSCTHLHFKVKDSFPRKKLVSFMLNEFSMSSHGVVRRHVPATYRVVGDFYLTNLGGAVGNCGGGWL